MDGAAELPQVRVAAPAQRPFMRLLGYVRAHPAPALLTALFGSAGFLLSFVYPWIVGSVVDLIQSTSGDVQRARRLWQLTQLAAATALGHALVVYGRETTR